MSTALDDVAFLANSENRVAALRLLVERPRSHDEIREEIGASRVTTARILREFEAREWIARSGQDCTITDTGAWVGEAFEDLLEEMAAERRLREPLQWMPVEDLPFDVRRLRDAELVVREESDATAVFRRIIEFRRSGDRVRGLARMVAPVFIENDWEATVQGDTSLEMVVTPDVLEVIRTHPTSARQLREMLEQSNVHVGVTPDVPLSLTIVDGAVGVDGTDDEGVVKGGFVSEDDVVYGWAVDQFESARADATPVSPEDVEAEPSEGASSSSGRDENPRQNGAAQ